MKEISKIFFKTLILFLVIFSVEVYGKIISDGNADAKVTVKVFSSLTCPACANFHSEIYYELKKEFIDPGLVRFEHHPFPLDLAALNAEIILRCSIEDEKKFELLGKIYKKQNSWAVGPDINRINDSIKKIGSEFDMKVEKMNGCLKSDKAQDEILNQRIQAQKKYKIQSTPTIFINEKKYSGKIDYKQFKKAIEKNL
tara:strand:- start:47 stop:640 length:594 start_codon:yes stop_codon:yes gene_type:complete